MDYAQEPLACPADGWLTLNSAARAQGPRPCAALPAVTRSGEGAEIQAMPQIVRDNQRFHESPDWGLLGTLASCTTAVGPGAALALASPSGAVDSYVPSPVGPVAVGTGPLPADRRRPGTNRGSRTGACLRPRCPAGSDRRRTAPEHPAPRHRSWRGGGNRPWPGAGRPAAPHVGAGERARASPHGLLDSSATRRPGIVTLTDLTPTVAAWLGHPVPAGTVGSQITRGERGDLGPTIASLTARDTAEQVWIATHGWFFIGYAIADALAFGLPALLFWGAAEERRRRRARAGASPGVAAAAVPLGSYLANLAPWWYWIHPAWWLYGMAIGWTLVVAAAALAGPWRRDALGPFGAIAAATLLLLAVDVMAGSRLQQAAPFGLSLLVSGRFYGIGNNALGVYCVAALVAAAWLRAVSSASAGPSWWWGRWGCWPWSPPAGLGSGRRWAGRSRSCPACCCSPPGWPGRDWASGGRFPCWRAGLSCSSRSPWPAISCRGTACPT